jgi:hypothetical protein
VLKEGKPCRVTSLLPAHQHCLACGTLAQLKVRQEPEPWFRRRYPKTRNFHVIRALNYLLQEHGLSQFSVEETRTLAWSRASVSLSLRQDLRTVIRKCRPDWDLTPPELKSAWEQGGKETVLSLRENVRPNHRRTGLDRSYD